MKYLKKILIILLVVALDLITKALIYGNDAMVINKVVSFKSTLNSGAAFSFLSGKTTLLTIISIVILVVLIVFDIVYKSKSKLYFASICLIFGGAVGNLVDRIAFGGVRDFIFLEFFPQFPIFNFADMCLTIGAVLLAVNILLEILADNKLKRKTIFNIKK